MKHLNFFFLNLFANKKTKQKQKHQLGTLNPMEENARTRLLVKTS